MATANLDVAVKKDWLPANPWLWLGAGAALCILAWLWTIGGGVEASDGRIVVLALGLLFSSVGTWLRFRDGATVYVRACLPPLARLVRLLMGAFFALAGLGMTALLLASFLERSGLHTGATVLAWLSIAPVATGAALRCLKRKPGQDLLEPTEEAGLAFCLLAGCCFVGTFVLLRDPEQPRDWDSIRMFLRVFTGVSLLGGALILASTGLRRIVLGGLFTLHFCGICNAALAAPPAPWIIQQSWVRLFRPYLEFMYLNNAYHFYAPEPGPSSYLWFRVIFVAEDGTDHGLWYKVPRLDDKGRIEHPAALEYQRYLSLTESIASTQPLPADFYFSPMYLNRMNLAQKLPKVVVVGKVEPKQPRIPLHPAIPDTLQVNIPSDMSKRLLSSFARHVAEKFATYQNEAGRPLTFKSVKAYRVVHSIPPVLWFQQRLPANDPIWYRPYYVGHFDKDGRMIEDGDPYLYWLMPVLRHVPGDPDSVIDDYCRKHAGDAEWVVDARKWN